MHLPHLQPFDHGMVVFLTTCTHERRPILANAHSHTILHEIWAQSTLRNGWYVGRYVIMPDHVHLFASAGYDSMSLSGWMQLWKAIAAKRLNRALARTGNLWQPDYFDRYIRSATDYTEKWDYIRQNPVRKGLTNSPDEWPYQGVIQDLKYRGVRL